MDHTRPSPNPWVADLAPYQPGKAQAPGVKRVVKLSANESVVGPSPAAVAACREAAATLERYPDPTATALREALAAHFGFDPDWIICGAGSDELLHLVVQAYAGPGDKVLHSRYGFMMYPISSRAVGAEPVAVPNRDWAADVDGLLAAVDERTKVVFLDNPNNPTGACLPGSEVRRLAESLPPHVVLVHDAAYAECVDQPDYEDGIALARDFPNVFTTRTFSKLYGLAALRVGWGVADPRLLDPMHRIRPPFNVTSPGQAAARAALADQEHLAKAREFTIRERRRLAAGLARIGLEVVPSETNFLLVRFPDEAPHRAEDANNWLARHGYLVRWLPGQGLADSLRITIGEEADNNAIIALLEEFMAQA
ncbi:MAG: histidinol-phosphate transaminase [Alphaproteobacteria bacterium]|nr:MAG: histidinol-phosphate transaminase [Alphaproteobacteria bacterium]